MLILLDIILSAVETETFWVGVGAIGGVAALFLTYLQLRASRIIAAADFLLRLEGTFNAQKMLVKRKQILLTLLQTPKDFQEMNAYRDVFDFFEELGLLVRKKIIPTELVWSDYCFCVLNYWTAFRSYVDWVRKSDEDPTLYCEFEYLFRKMRDFENHKLRKKVEMTPERLAGFIKDEIELLSKEIECA